MKTVSEILKETIGLELYSGNSSNFSKFNRKRIHSYGLDRSNVIIRIFEILSYNHAKVAIYETNPLGYDDTFILGYDIVDMSNFRRL